MPDAAISLVGGAKVFISTVIADPTLAQFQLVGRTWTEIKGVESIGDFGDESEIVTFKSVDANRVRKLKGTADAGTLELTVGRDPLDAGQVAARAAAKTKNRYAFRIVCNDAPDGGTVKVTTHYIGAIVASAKKSMAGADDVIKEIYSLAIDCEPLTVEATV